MALAGGNISPLDLFGPRIPHILAGITGVGLFIAGLSQLYITKSNGEEEDPGIIRSLLLFAYGCFFKPHTGGADDSQQSHLESFYANQASIYDRTRKTLLHGREDMLALVAAQLKAKSEQTGNVVVVAGEKKTKRIWVDVGGGTGFNIEAMSQFVDVPTFYTSVYLVDFSPSLCAVAKKRFERLGWTNVRVICEDARKFRLEDYEDGLETGKSPTRSPGLGLGYFTHKRAEHGGADLITMSYSLSMMPDYFSIVDSITSLLSPHGIMGVVDFYAQSGVDFAFRNFTGGTVNRHVNYFSRTFWRGWFDLDRVSLEPARRDYLEYRFGTVLTVNERNRSLGVIPYYIWVGCHKKPFSSSSLPHEIIERIDALATESPLLLPASTTASNVLTRAIQRTAPEIRSKAFDAAVSNISAQLPLPSFFYQNHHWRIYYDDQLEKHRKFKDEYIYAFTWEDSAVDEDILKLGANDVVLAITSAGDNILSYARQSPARIHAVDLNPTQNHLLELKVAAYAASLPYTDFWKIFGEGKHAEFRTILITQLSPHLSSRSFQYWLAKAHIFTSPSGRGLYDTGGSKHAIRSFRWISQMFCIRGAVRDLLSAKTLNEQREIWRDRLRPTLLSRTISDLVVSTEKFLWSALGVPKNQLAMIEADYTARFPNSSRAKAVWQYMVDTLDPVAQHSLISTSNPYYHVCLAGSFSRHCHPDYLSPQTHARLSRPGAFDGLRIHTDEIEQVISRFSPGTLTVAVVMDSMDWFDPGTDAAGRQISMLNRALGMGGRVLLRSAGVKPWYIAEFESRGFDVKRVGVRGDGRYIDRVNMYASCWVCTKVAHLPPLTPPGEMVGGEVEGWTLDE